MRFLLAPTAYKGTLSPIEATEAMAEGVVAALPSAELDRCPIADGGTGWLEVWAFHCREHAERYRVQTVDALNRPIEAEWLFIAPHFAVVESAQACGLHLLSPDKLAPLDATSEGVGILLREAAAHPRVQEIWLGLGGVASTDGGLGALCQLGFQVYGAHGNPVPPDARGLLSAERIETPSQPPLKGKRLKLCADVENPMVGAEGSARVYAPQKGANAEQVALLEQGLTRWAELLERTFGTPIGTTRGAGAAGGLAGGLSAALGAPIVSGIGWLMRHIGWNQRLAQADYLFTGEGQVDSQTLMGKGVGVLVQSAVALGKPVWILAGRAGEGAETLSQLPAVQVATLLTDAPDKTSPNTALRSLCTLIVQKIIYSTLPARE